jgi:hypothetical protein
VLMTVSGPTHKSSMAGRATRRFLTQIKTAQSGRASMSAFCLISPEAIKLMMKELPENRDR